MKALYKIKNNSGVTIIFLRASSYYEALFLKNKYCRYKGLNPGLHTVSEVKTNFNLGEL